MRGPVKGFRRGPIGIGVVDSRLTGVDNGLRFLIGWSHDELTRVIGEGPQVYKVHVLVVLVEERGTTHLYGLMVYEGLTMGLTF